MSDYTSDVKSSQPDLSPAVDDSQKILVSILGAVAFSHCCNDFIQAMLPSIYPLLKTNFTLSYAQIGLITLIYQMTASLLQPWIGLYTDKHPKPWLLPSGMVSTLIGIGLLAMAPHFSVVLVASALIGVGSATFHPEASRVARMASGGRFGTAQSTFQVGGYIGTAFAPLVAAMLIIPHGQIAVGWLMIIALFAVIILSGISRWTVKHGHAHMKKHNLQALRSLSSRDVKVALSVVGVLLLAKFTYIASISNYYIFYLVERFQLPIPQAQIYLFTFLAAVAVGTLAGGPIGDRIGRKAVVWISFLGVIPFSLLMPHANL